MSPGQTLARLRPGCSRARSAARRTAPGHAIVQGDTTTTMAGALAAFYRGIPVGHVEAGLRTGNLAEPFPEELNRVLAGRLAALHFAPTERAPVQSAVRRHAGRAHPGHRESRHRCRSGSCGRAVPGRHAAR